MGNSSNGLLITGIMLVCILIISAGLFVYNSSQGTISEAQSSLTTQEVEAFNNQFLPYEGLQNATGLKALLTKLTANASNYEENTQKIPGIYIDRMSETGDLKHAEVPVNGNITEYLNVIRIIRNGIKQNHKYLVELSYQDNGLIDYVTISYDENNKVDAMAR